MTSSTPESTPRWDNGACPYALSHEDGWSRQHLLNAAVRRLNRAFTGAVPAREEGMR